MIGPHRNRSAGTAESNLLANAAPFVMYKTEINVSGQLRVSLFRGPGCRKTTLDCWNDHLDRAEAGEDPQHPRLGIGW